MFVVLALMGERRDDMGTARSYNPVQRPEGRLLVGGAVPARCLTTTAATPWGCVLHGQRVLPRAGTLSAEFPLVGWVRGNPALGSKGERRFSAPFRALGPFSLSSLRESEGFPPAPWGESVRLLSRDVRESGGFPER